MDHSFDLIRIGYTLFLFIISSILHEYFHGHVADRLGDPTARYAGRLTLDPRAHIDAWGSIFMPLLLFALTNGKFVFAYAKPVPYNPHNLKNQKWGPALVGVAGPLANLLLALAVGIVFRFVPYNPLNPSLTSIFLSDIVYVNILLMFFNLMPIPPLDGSKVLFALIPDSMSNVKMFLERYGLVILIIFIAFIFKLFIPTFEHVISLFLFGTW